MTSEPIACIFDAAPNMSAFSERRLILRGSPPDAKAIASMASSVKIGESAPADERRVDTYSATSDLERPINS